MHGNLFSESWFKVADLRVGLLSSVDVQKQYYRGTLWYILRDRFNNNYFRVTPEAYSFIVMLTPDRTVQEIWEECLDIFREKAPSQDEVIGLMSQLHTNNLLYFSNAANSEFVFERHYEKKQKELKSKLLSFISIKIPLWNPDKWLNRILPFIKAIFSYKGLIIWIVVVLLGFKAVADNIYKIFDQTQGMLSPSNLIFVYIALAFLKSFHEIGHAMMNKYFGGPVHSVGVMFLVFTPLPYMDATSSWFFQKRIQRVLVGSAGMLVEVFFAAIAALIWANTGDGLIHGLAFNIMVIGSVTSLFFNGNPLIRYDSYYILSDILEIPNLYQRSRSQWLYLLEKYLFKVENTIPPSDNPREAFWLSIYAACSLAYRIFVSIAIILFVADRFFSIGLLIAIISLFTGVLYPIKGFIEYLLNSPKLNKTRRRAFVVSGGLIAILIFFLGFCPFFNSIRAPGILEARGFSKIYAETEGKLEKVYFKNGAYVKKGETIALLSNHELDLDIKTVEAALSQTKAIRQKAIVELAADLKPLNEREKVLSEELAMLCERKKKLTVAAPGSGFFVAPDIQPLQGMWLRRQRQLGVLIEDGSFRFSGIISQEQAAELFKEKSLKVQVKMYGNAGKTLDFEDIVVIPYQKEELPSAALGWRGGGDIPVSTSDKSGKKVTEPFFIIVGTMKFTDKIAPMMLLHGRSGVLRMVLPPEPLAVQFYKLVKQNIQKRYKI